MVKWSNPEKGVAPSVHLSVVAIEKGTFGSPLTTFANFTLIKIELSLFFLESKLVVKETYGRMETNRHSHTDP